MAHCSGWHFHLMNWTALLSRGCMVVLWSNSRYSSTTTLFLHCPVCSLLFMMVSVFLQTSEALREKLNLNWNRSKLFPGWKKVWREYTRHTFDGHIIKIKRWGLWLWCDKMWESSKVINTFERHCISVWKRCRYLLNVIYYREVRWGTKFIVTLIRILSRPLSK